MLARPMTIQVPPALASAHPEAHGEHFGRSGLLCKSNPQVYEPVPHPEGKDQQLRRLQ